MKFSLAILFALTSIAYAIPNAETAQLEARTSLAQRAASACGASGSCHGAGGSDLCNDRCKRCVGDTGAYDRGDCCGFLGQACCCYYD